MSQEEFDKIMGVSKTICIFVFRICFFGSILASWLFGLKEKVYGILIILVWILGFIPYVTYGFVVPFFIEKILKIKVKK
jgi:hypothetical protein